MPDVEAFIAEALRFQGQRYVYGAEIPTSWDAQKQVGPVDCSELTSVAARRVGAGAGVPDGAYNQAVAIEQAGRLIPASEAIRHRGYALFYDDGYGTGRDRVTHVAISMGDGVTTFEARSESYPVGYQKMRSSFTTGGPFVGITYSGTTPPPQPPPADITVTLEVEGGGTVALRQLQQGHTGRDVRQLQALLSEWAVSPGAHDGDFGPATYSAVRTFQQSMGLLTDGIVGRDTWTRCLGR